MKDNVINHNRMNHVILNIVLNVMRICAKIAITDTILKILNVLQFVEMELLQILKSVMMEIHKMVMDVIQIVLLLKIQYVIMMENVY